MKHSFAVDRKLFQSLQKLSNRVILSNGHALFRQGDPPSGLYILCKGDASLIMKSEAGKVLLSLEVTAASILGLPGLIANKPYTCSAVACPGAEVRFVAQKDFEQVMQSDPALYPKVLQVLACDVRSILHAFPEFAGKLGAAAPMF